MVREVVVLVSADDVISAVRVHADRVNDMLRRNGTPAGDAAALAERFAADLITMLDQQPHAVGDLAGWWFGRCLSAVVVEPFAVVGDEARVRAILGNSETEQAVRTAIASLNRPQRVALMFRDAYDLPLQAVAVALDRSSAVTADLIAGARLALMTAYDGVAPPDTAAHVGRQAIDLPGLAGVADGSGDPPTMLALRRHVTACPVCEDLLERMGRARRLALGLPVLALADADREELIEGTTAQAVAMLPTHEEVLAAAAAEVETRGLSLVAVAGLLVVAGAIGVGVGALSRHLEQSDLTAPVGGQPLPSIPADTPVVALSSRPAPSTSTKTSVSLPPIIISTSRSATPIRSTAPVTPTTSSPAVPAAAAIAIDPTTGPAGTPITVTGAGFLPGSPVTVSYAGSGTTTTSTDGHGNFQAVIDASAALPGAYDITASDGVDSASRTFHQTA